MQFEGGPDSCSCGQKKLGAPASWAGKIQNASFPFNGTGCYCGQQKMERGPKRRRRICDGGQQQQGEKMKRCTSILTGPFTIPASVSLISWDRIIPEPCDQEIGEVYLVQERRTMDFEARKLR